MTDNMRAFISKNSKVEVDTYIRTDSNGNEVTDPSKFNYSTLTKYTFTDGESMSLTRDDLKSAEHYFNNK